MKILFLADVPFNSPTSGAEQVLDRQISVLNTKTDDICAITRKNGSSDQISYFEKDGIKAAFFIASPRNLFHFLSAMPGRTPSYNSNGVCLFHRQCGGY